MKDGRGVSELMQSAMDFALEEQAKCLDGDLKKHADQLPYGARALDELLMAQQMRDVKRLMVGLKQVSKAVLKKTSKATKEVQESKVTFAAIAADQIMLDEIKQRLGQYDKFMGNGQKDWLLGNEDKLSEASWLALVAVPWLLEKVQGNGNDNRKY